MNLTIINPFTGRKVRQSGPTYAKVEAALITDPKALYKLCDIDDPHVFASNFVHMEAAFSFPPYDPTVLDIVFHPNGKWESCSIRDRCGQIASFDPSSSLYTASVTPSAKNECDMATVDTLDDWSDLPRWRLVATTDGYHFDIFFILKAITNQLNQIKNGNAFPVFPRNPFTSVPFDTHFFKLVEQRVKRNDLFVDEVLTVFLRDPRTENSVTDWVDVFEQAGLYFTRTLNDDSGYWSSEKPPPTGDIFIVFLRDDGDDMTTATTTTDDNSDTESDANGHGQNQDQDQNQQDNLNPTDQEILDYLFATRTLYNDFFFEQ